MGVSVLTDQDGPAWVGVSVQIELVPDLRVLGDGGEPRTASHLSLQVRGFSVIKVSITEVFVYTRVTVFFVGVTKFKRHARNVSYKYSIKLILLSN